MVEVVEEVIADDDRRMMVKPEMTFSIWMRHLDCSHRAVAEVMEEVIDDKRMVVKPKMTSGHLFVAFDVFFRRCCNKCMLNSVNQCNRFFLAIKSPCLLDSTRKWWLWYCYFHSSAFFEQPRSAHSLSLSLSFHHFSFTNPFQSSATFVKKVFRELRKGGVKFGESASQFERQRDVDGGEFSDRKDY